MVAHTPAGGALVARRRSEQQGDAEADDVLNPSLGIDVLVYIAHL
jgi:hypothetical protein